MTEARWPQRIRGSRAAVLHLQPLQNLVHGRGVVERDVVAGGSGTEEYVVVEAVRCTRTDCDDVCRL